MEISTENGNNLPYTREVNLSIRVAFWGAEVRGFYRNALWLDDGSGVPWK